MINLLPPDLADGIRYGRHNAKIRRWLFGAALATVGLLAIIIVGWFYLNNQAKGLNRELLAKNQQLQAQQLDKVQKEADEITSSIKTINQVLGREIQFSQLIQDVGQVMPPGSVLSGLLLKNKIDGALDLSANTRDYASAAQIAANLSDPKNKLFGSVDIVTVNCSSGDALYKCTATFRALFSKDAKNRYLNVAGSSS